MKITFKNEEDLLKEQIWIGEKAKENNINSSLLEYPIMLKYILLEKIKQNNINFFDASEKSRFGIFSYDENNEKVFYDIINKKINFVINEKYKDDEMEITFMSQNLSITDFKIPIFKLSSEDIDKIADDIYNDLYGELEEENVYFKLFFDYNVYIADEEAIKQLVDKSYIPNVNIGFRTRYFKKDLVIK